MLVSVSSARRNFPGTLAPLRPGAGGHIVPRPLHPRGVLAADSFRPRSHGGVCSAHLWEERGLRDCIDVPPASANPGEVSGS